MSILTKKNGVALIAVLAILLILTLLIPAMFTMSETATEAAMRGTDQFRATYLARTMIEMTVAAFQDAYDAAEEHTVPYEAHMQKFLEQTKKMDAQTVYMYRNDSIEYPKKPKRAEYPNEDEYDVAMEGFNAQLAVYEESGIIYSTSATAPAGCTFVGSANCTVTYNDETSYYSIDPDGNTTPIDVDEYAGGKEKLEQLISQGVDATSQTQYVKIQNKNVVFESSATVKGKGGVRRCVMVLPTKPAEENWITMANLEVGCNQIFPDSSKATGRTNINYQSGTFIDGSALKQPLYIFSCIGNMVISDKDLQVTRANANGLVETIPYTEYLRENNASYRPQDMSFGLHPETGTREPDNDPAFNCLRTYNMRSWSQDAQLDNFVAYTATNAIQVDLPVNLLVNPCRTNRIGDGLDKNYSLYKVLVFQAPTIVFNKTVNSMISLNVEDNAYRMTSIMFAAPKNTPYSYANGSRGKKVVKAGKVFFAEDAYIWVIPFEDNGSGYNTQTVYYKNDDIILYKIANAGDIYYFNAEIQVDINGKMTNSGFSLTGYFMDVIYNQHGDDFTNNNWWNLWSNAKQKLYNNLHERYSERTYLPDDFKWVGNVYNGTGDKLPVVDDFYVIWDS
ncbi:MAG: hypothetical protein J6Q83_03300 [Clostridia bacterium]|nr:hypothetical protein [Clostridia bacterium]